MGEVVPHGLPGVFTDGRTLYTINLIPGQSVYGEKLVPHLDVQYRAWNPKRSKLAAFILKGCRTFPFRKDSTVLYLGAATGTTASHLSDIVTEGSIYCVEISPPPFRKLVSLCETRHNMIPILEDANSPETYEHLTGRVDIVYQDIAQRHQVDIFVKNLRLLEEDGTAFFMVKARSIDVSMIPENVYSSVKDDLRRAGLKIVESKELAPYEKDHMAIVLELTDHN
ncbi:MAG: fibrillarin-like rRNA/tRNA 2'-O-methyltransferase [Thermoplasmata archaeon]|nr:fibrillarin-like rRNA/tRNA 2'-O-methyltransferase [Thermoplasmata archaeon]